MMISQGLILFNCLKFQPVNMTGFINIGKIYHPHNQIINHERYFKAHA